MTKANPGQNPPNPNRVSGRINDGGRYGYRLPYKRETAIKRQNDRNQRTPEEQLTLLDQRLGKGLGATKERARLHRLINNK